MLRGVKGLHGDSLKARDGEIGSVDEVLFDDEHWTVRYLVADTGGWLFGRKVLISTVALAAVDWEQRILNVNLTREQIENSPGVGTHEPVSRQWEADYHDYYAWPYYWGGMGLNTGLGFSGGLGLSAVGYPGALLPSAEGDARRSQEKADERARGHQSARDRGDVHLRSTREVTSYGIAARDGHLGHVEDFIVDDETWKIRYLAVDTNNWWLGKKVLLPLDWIGQANWPDRTVTVEITRDQVRNAPEWDPHMPISRTLEDELSTYYARQRMAAYAPA